MRESVGVVTYVTLGPGVGHGIDPRVRPDKARITRRDYGDMAK